MQNIKRIGYYPQIDGLRGLGSIAFLLYHLEFEFFPGGYVALDIFFVISGFLITNLIVAELKHSNKFSFVNFYFRRVRRLTPGFICTLVLTFTFSYLIMPPIQFQDFGGSLLSSAFGLANLHFSLQFDYFQYGVIFIPLLHTWSLSLEEQFYIFLPICLFFLNKFFRPVTTPLILALIGFISLISCYLMKEKGLFLDFDYYQRSAFSYYLLPFRAYELLIGSLLVWMPKYKIRSKITSELLLFLALVMVILPTILLKRENTLPNILSIMACLGTAVIISIKPTKYFGKILNCRALLFIGVRSYSIYLLHWPLISLYKYITLDKLDIVEQTILAFAAIVLGCIQFSLVENFFRYKGNYKSTRSKLTFISINFLLLALIGLTGLHIWKFSRWNWRFGGGTHSNLNQHGDIDKSYYGGLICNSHPCTLGPKNNQKPVYVIGDSLSVQLAYGLHVNFPETTFKIFKKLSCPIFSKKWLRGGHTVTKEHCLEVQKKFLEEIQKVKPKIIFASGWGDSTYFKYDHRTAQIIQREILPPFGKNNAHFLLNEMKKLKTDFDLPGALVIGLGPILPAQMSDLNLCLLRPKNFLPISKHCKESFDYKNISEFQFLSTFNNTDLTVLNFFKPFCNENQCIAFDSKYHYFADKTHLSEAGSEKAIKYFKPIIQNWLKK